MALPSPRLLVLVLLVTLAGAPLLPVSAGPVPEAVLDPATYGAWSEPMVWPVQAEHMAMLPSGEVLAFISQNGAITWDPATGTTTDVAPGGDHTINCAGHAFLSDGRLVVNGGIGATFAGHPVTWVFNATDRSWESVEEMAEDRYYPSTLTLPDGDVLTLSGNLADGFPATTVERFEGGTGTWETMPGADREMDMYPRVHVLPDGRVVRVGQERATLFLDPGTGTWSDGPLALHGQRWGGTSALLPGLDRVLVVGGGSMGLGGEGGDTAGLLRDDTDGVLENLVDGTVQGTSPATNTAEVLDLSGETPVWREVGSMLFDRRDHSATILADGSVAVFGGAYGFEPIPGWGETALTPERFDPTSETWSLLAPPERHRGYHQASVLLPDGRVLVAGGDFEWGTGTTEPILVHTAELYSPPYLFQGPRPVITDAPATVGYGGSFAVASHDAASIDQVALVRLGSVTHSVNTDQRFVTLDFERHGNALVVDGPVDGAQAPPGPYFLVVLDDGVPSEGWMVGVG